MKQSTLFILTILFFSCSDSGKSVFTDETYQDTLRQNVGGSLIRTIHHYNDFQSFNYDIEYSYADKDSAIEIGTGSYYGQEPPNDEQLVRHGKWLLFKTCGDRDKDLLFICDSETKKWTKFEISPETIEQTNLWKEQRIDSQVDNWDTVSKIEKIDPAGNIIVLYTYAKKNRLFSFMTDEREITYRINQQSGEPEIAAIKKI